MAVDRLHFSGHVDPWCHKNCDPDSFKDLEDVSYSITIPTSVAKLLLSNICVVLMFLLHTKQEVQKLKFLYDNAIVLAI